MNFMNIEPRSPGGPQADIKRRTRRHWLLRSMAGVFAVGTVLAASSGAEQTNSFPSQDSFSIIERNNIFNPNRRPELVHTNRTNRTARTPAFALVGTQLYAKGKFAFFNGSDSQYEKVLEPGGIIAGYTIKDVTLTNATLTASGKDFSMPVGTQMRNLGPNKWELSGHIIEEPTAEETNDETTAAEPTTAPTGGSPAMNDVLKQMMERRQQELNK
jgi:hypothetical protein